MPSRSRQTQGVSERVISLSKYGGVILVAWIKSHQELRNHPKTSRLARFCAVPLAQAIGHLHILWWSAIDYAADGDLSMLDDEEIAALAGWNGDPATFVEALYKAGFIDKIGDGYAIHDWDEYAGKLVDDREKKKEQDRDRAKAYRERKKNGHAPVTHDNVTRHATIAPVDKTREEKTREEKNKDYPQTTAENPAGIQGDAEETPIQPDKGKAGKTSESNYPVEFEGFWASYPRKIEKKATFAAWKSAVKTSEDKSDAILAAKNYAAQMARLKQSPEYIKHGATFLNKERWRDYIRASPEQGVITDEEKRAIIAKYTGEGGVQDAKAIARELYALERERGVT